ncbi:unnamed protein product, partial [Rotaria socialis]
SFYGLGTNMNGAHAAAQTEAPPTAPAAAPVAPAPKRAIRPMPAITTVAVVATAP